MARWRWPEDRDSPKKKPKIGAPEDDGDVDDEQETTKKKKYVETSLNRPAMRNDGSGRTAPASTIGGNAMPKMKAPPRSLTAAPTELIHAPVTFDADVPGSRPSFGFDPIEILPAVAADKLRLLRQRSADAFALCVPFSELQDASVAKQGAEQRLKRLVDHPSEGGFGLKDDDARVVTARKTLAKLADDLSRLNQRGELRTASWHATSRTLAACEEWLKTGRPGNCTLEPVEVELPRPAKGENGLLDQIENRRRRVRELRADQHRIESSCLPANIAKAKMRSEIDALVARGAPDVSPMIEHLDGKIGWPLTTLRSTIFNSPGAVAFAETPDVLAVFAWTFKDALVKRLDAEIDANSDDPNSMSPEERERRSAEVLGDIIDIEMQEATMVFAAQRSGIAVEQRPDITPLALLGCRLITTPRAAPAVGSSVEHQMVSWAGLPG